MVPLTSRSKPNIVALVPVRHVSERVPGKNYGFFAGKPLYRHIINRLMACPHISKLIIDTDSQTLREDVQGHFLGVRLIERPEHLRAGTVTMNDILLYDMSQMEADYCLQR